MVNSISSPDVKEIAEVKLSVPKIEILGKELGPDAYNLAISTEFPPEGGITEWSFGWGGGRLSVSESRIRLIQPAAVSERTENTLVWSQTNRSGPRLNLNFARRVGIDRSVESNQTSILFVSQALNKLEGLKDNLVTQGMPQEAIDKLLNLLEERKAKIEAQAQRT